MVQELFTFLEIIKDPNHFGSYGLYLSVYVRNKNGGVRKILIHFKITINRLCVNINETISFLKKSTIFFSKANNKCGEKSGFILPFCNSRISGLRQLDSHSSCHWQSIAIMLFWVKYVKKIQPHTGMYLEKE